MALKGRDGQRFSHAPQPMHFSTFTTGIFGESVFSGSEATICMAPVGQWRAQLPHSIPSVKGTQFSLIHTACPIWIADFSARLVRWIAPAGQTSEHLVHSGRQYPRSYDISGWINVIRMSEGRNTWLGQTDTHNWQAVQCWVKLRALNAPGG